MPPEVRPPAAALNRQIVDETHRSLSPPVFGALAVVLGFVAGLGAFGFRILIALCHNLAFLGRLSTVYDTNRHTPAGPWGPAVAFVPIAGSICVIFLVLTFAPEASGHGVPEVMDAIYYKNSVIRPVVAAIKALASAISIGTGGSVGREGPIIQIGAAFASFSGRMIRVSRWQRATLVAAGGGAGIAATFNTPIGGMLFAVEVLLHEVSARTLVPVALATTTATYVARYLFGSAPAFPVPPLHIPETAALLPAYACLGVVSAAASVVFIRMLYGGEDLFEQLVPKHPYIRHAIGMLIVGVMFTTLFRLTGHYYIEGVGYATIIDVLTGSVRSIWFLLLLWLLKLVATSCTLGSGASGGIFSPSLFMGATLGAAYAGVLQHFLPALEIHPAVFALAGMAGLVAGATGAALTAIVMIFEMTLNYAVVLPMTFVVAVSYGLRRLILPESIYTMKLVRRGHVMPYALQANAHLVRHVAGLAISKADVLPAGSAPARMTFDEDGNGAAYFVFVKDDQIAGFISREWALTHTDVLRNARRLDQLVRPDFVTVTAEATLFELLATMQHARASVAIVTARVAKGAGRLAGRLDIKGVIGQAEIARALTEGLELFED
ncbi:MAG TPA: chloride channel protein [Terriglobia bacterium]|jgi:CIC family chloride channel protein